MKCYWETDKNGFKKPKKKLWCKKCGYDAVYIEPHLSPVVKSQEDHTVIDWMEIGAYYYHYSPDYSLGCPVGTQRPTVNREVEGSSPSRGVFNENITAAQQG